MATALTKPSLDWKLNPHFPDTLDFLSEFDVGRYRLQRRLIGPLYASSNLRKFESAVDSVLTRAISELRSLQGAEIDLKEWMHIVAVECLGAVVLSWSPGYIKNRSDGGTSKQSYLGWKRKSVFGLFPTMTKLTYLSKALRRAFSDIWGVTFSIPKNFKPFFTVSSCAGSIWEWILTRFTSLYNRKYQDALRGLPETHFSHTGGKMQNTISWMT